MDPITLAGILATAYGLGLIPQSKHDALLAGILGYGAGHVGGKGNNEEQFRAQEERHRREMQMAQQRERELVHRLSQQEQTQRTQQSLKETLARAAAAHNSRDHQ